MDELTWNKYRCRKYYDEHREALLEKKRQKRIEKNGGVDRPPGRPRKPDFSTTEIQSMLAKLNADKDRKESTT